MFNRVKKFLTKNSGDKGVTDKKPKLAISRLVFNENTTFRIRKTWLAEVKNGRILVPKYIREDTTGRKHLTNDINSGEMYNTGILLTEPENNEWGRPTWRCDNTIRFRGYITQNNYITIPVELRDKYQIHDGDNIQIAVTKRIFEQETNTPNKSHVPEWMRI